MSVDTATHQSPPSLAADFSFIPSSIAEQIDDTGFSCLPAAVNQEWLAEVREYATDVASGGHETMLEGLDRVGPDFVGDLIGERRLQDLLEGVAAVAHPRGDRQDRRLDCALRVINGPDPADRPLWFHYDATVVTLVIPVVIPDGEPGQSGELVLFPNRRPFRKFVALNVVEKLIAQSNTYRKRFLRHRDVASEAETIPLEPGNAYLFWGYRSYHATMPCPEGSKRVTVIIHYKDVHSGSKMLRFAKATRKRMARPAA